MFQRVGILVFGKFHVSMSMLLSRLVGGNLKKNPFFFQSPNRMMSPLCFDLHVAIIVSSQVSFLILLPLLEFTHGKFSKICKLLRDVAAPC